MAGQRPNRPKNNNPMKQKTECCAQCPFARATPKEYLDAKASERGESDLAEMFIGQAAGPFLLPCHMTREFEDFRDDPHASQLCAGAAKYRANCGYDKFLSPALGQLPPDREAAFGDPAELAVHHAGVTLQVARIGLAILPVQVMVANEMEKVGVQRIMVPPPDARPPIHHPWRACGTPSRWLAVILTPYGRPESPPVKLGVAEYEKV